VWKSKVGFTIFQKKEGKGLVAIKRRQMKEAKLKIAKIDVFTADLHLKSVYQHSAARLDKYEQVYLKLTSVDGLAGYAEVRGNCPYVTHEVRKDILEALSEEFTPIIKKNKSASIEDIIDLVNKNISSYGAKTLIDVTFHDISAKLKNLPLCEYLGTKELEEIMGYCGVPFSDLEETASKVQKGLETGYKLFKVRVGVKDFKRDLERVELVRELASNKDIAIDANRAWEVQEAIAKINELSTYNLAFAEQPIEHGDLQGLRTVKESVDVPIMADESLMSIDSLERLLAEEAVDMLNVKVLKAGGLNNVSKIIEKADANAIPFLFGSMSTGMLDAAATLHAQCSIGSNAKYFSGGGFNEVIDDPTSGLEEEDGKIRVPTEPGLGVNIDETILHREFSIEI